jgi:hypothetical protein
MMGMDIQVKVFFGKEEILEGSFPPASWSAIRGASSDVPFEGSALPYS